MATVQVNARLDAETKQAGDQALQAAGYSPTRAIRALWTFAERNRHDLAALKGLLRTLEGGETKEQNSALQQRMDHLKEGQIIYERALAEMGVTASRLSAMPYEELLAQAHHEKEAERGLA